MTIQVDSNEGIVFSNVCKRDNGNNKWVARRRKRSTQDNRQYCCSSDAFNNLSHNNVVPSRRYSQVVAAVAVSVVLTICSLSRVVSSFNIPATFTTPGIRQPYSLLSSDTNRFNRRSIQSNNIHHSLSELRLQIEDGSGQEVAKGVNLNSSASSSTSTTSTPVPGIVGVRTSGPPPFSVTLDDATQYSYKDAIQRTLIWVTAALFFGSALWLGIDAKTGEEFFAGYLVEQSLSVDNLFVFLLLFEYFQIPLQYQDRILNWGIYGAIVMRVIMIGLGVAALEHFRGVLLVFAAILVYGSAKFFINADNEDEEDEDPNDNAIIQFAQRFVKSTNVFDGDRFFTIIDGIRTATPLFICMIALELSDVVFAIDSIPAVFGVTEVCNMFCRLFRFQHNHVGTWKRTNSPLVFFLCMHGCFEITKNPMVIITSNLFAIMGLRSLYTILSKAAADLKYLEPAVAVVLGFIGSKMIAEYVGYDIPTNISLIVVATLLGGGVAASVLEKKYSSPSDNDSSLLSSPITTTTSPTTLPNSEAGADTR
jgi:predicted tellurium resistance membrane protein TerC